MNAWSWIGLLCGSVFLLNAWKVRRRLARLSSVPGFDSAHPERGRGDYLVWLAPGASLSEQDQGAAIAFAIAQKLDVLDLVPQRWRTSAALLFAQAADLERFRNSRLALGHSAGQALVVRRALAERAHLAEAGPKKPVDFIRVARRLKCYAPVTFDFALAPGLGPAPLTPADRRALMGAFFAQMTPAALSVQGLILALIGVAAWRGGIAGMVGGVMYSAAPMVSLWRSAISPSDLFLQSVFAVPLQLLNWARVVACGDPDSSRRQATEALRQPYAVELAPGTERFFEPRVPTCYVCGSDRLSPSGHFSDLVQHKPGRFTLEQCRECGHIQQNPRLSLEGLGFYYRDFYDGLDGDSLELVFGLSPTPYLTRARLAPKAPQRWLDVGGGYGHFCCVAREIWPQTRFECLDMGASVDEAVARGWVEAGYRGQLADFVQKLSSRYDVVSLFHCLEHSRDPRSELAGAYELLVPGGTLLIEVPDPDSAWRKILGPLWMPYFQPQHQHLLSAKNLSRLLTEKGYVIDRVEKFEGNVRAGFTLGLFLLLERIARPDKPWLPPRAAPLRALAPLVWILATPLFAAAWLVDQVLRLVIPVSKGANAFGIVAHRPQAPAVAMKAAAAS